MPFELTATQQIVLTINPTVKGGKPGEVDPSVPAVWASSNEAVGTVVPIAGTLNATFIAQAPGTADVTGSVDADLGAGVKTVIAIDTITVTRGETVAATLSASAPTEQP